MAYIPGYGPSSAKLMVIGEQPSRDDMVSGQPFSGNSGQMVRRFLTEVGVDPNSVYYTYVLKEPTTLTREQRATVLGAHADQCRREIEALMPNCILGFGNVPLLLCTGNRGIDDYRGSILPSRLGPKFVGTIHPYSLRMPDMDGKVKSWIDSSYVRWDFERAAKQSMFKELRSPRRNLICVNSSRQLAGFLERNAESLYCAIDIETFKTVPICIALAFNRNEAISVPLLYVGNPHNEPQMSRSEQVECWLLISRLLSNPAVLKIGQNFKFDGRLLERCCNDTIEYGMHTKGLFFDTNLAMRTLFPELPATLSFICSIMTEEPYYKAEGREYHPNKDRLSRLLLYNAKDAVVTFEAFEMLTEEMSRIECWPGYRLIDFFFERVMPLHPFYSRLERRGILRDPVRQGYLLEKYSDLLTEAQAKLDEGALKYWPDKEVRKYKSAKTGEVKLKRFNAGSNGPSGEMKKLVFGYMKCPIRKGTDEKTIDTMIRNSVKDPEKIAVLENIVSVRKIDKAIGTYICAKPDYRGRFLTQVRLALETGRTSNAILKQPVFTEAHGSAFQTLTKHGEQGSDIRMMYIPDPGWIFFEPDLSQAEARVVALLAKDEKLQKMFTYGVDVHRVTAGWMEKSCPDDLLQQFFEEPEVEAVKEIVQRLNQILKSLVSDELRQTGKKFRHAGHYDMGEQEASQQTNLPQWRTKQLLYKFHTTNSAIRGVFHKEIKEALQENSRILVSPHGRRRQFLNEWGPDLWKEAYAQIPQATVSDHLKFAAIRIEKRVPYIRMLSESHDSFLAMLPLVVGAQYPFSKADAAMRISKEELEVPIDFKNCTLPRGELIIPCDLSIGRESWYQMEKYRL